MVSVVIGFFLSLIPKVYGEEMSFDFNTGPGGYFSTSNTSEIWNRDLDGPALRISKDADDCTVNGTIPEYDHYITNQNIRK